MTTYFVSTTGNDSNNGTSLATAFRTPQKAMQVANPGDRIQAKAGTYNGVIETTKAGLANNPITLTVAPGDEHKVILDGGNSKIRITKSFWNVNGWKVQNVSDVGILVQGPGVSNVIVEGNWCYNTFSSGIAVWGTPWQTDPTNQNYRGCTNIIIRNNKLQKNCNGGWNERITIANGVDTIEVYGNEIWEKADSSNGGEGLDLKAGVANAKIFNNHIHDISLMGIYVDAAGVGTYYKVPPVMKNIEIFDNTVYTQSGTAIQLSTEASGFIDGVKVYNNRVSKAGIHGILVYRHPNAPQWASPHPAGVVKNVQITNNTVYKSSSYGILLNSQGSFNITIKDNIAYLNGTNLSVQTPGTGLVNTGNFTTGDPMFVNAEAFDFNLRAGSPAVGKGWKAGTTPPPNPEPEPEPEPDCPYPHYDVGTAKVKLEDLKVAIRNLVPKVDEVILILSTPVSVA